MTILQKIQSLLTAANTKTGESDTTLTDAVQTLIDGYGQGGGTSITVEPLTVTRNGTQTAPSGKAYSPVTVNVPQPSGTINIVANGQQDVSMSAVANVNVEPSVVWLNFGSEGGTATLANPFPGLDYNDLAAEFAPRNGRLEAFISFEISGIQAAFHPFSQGSNIVGMAFVPDGGDGNPIGGYALWTNIGRLSTLLMYVGGQMQDLTAMAASIPCDTAIYGTDAPTSTV